jgi:predicted esterase
MNGPHQGGLMVTAGVPVGQASAAMILLHGRGGSAGGIMKLIPEADIDDMAYVAPEAAGNSWWPSRFIAPLEHNEPYFSSALAQVETVVSQLMEAGMPSESIILLGFSQGACLALEFAARNPRRYGGIVSLSGGLFGPPGTPRDYPGSLDGTPVFIGCSDVDEHIPRDRVEESAAVFDKMGAEVTMRLYPGMGHTVNADEMDFVRKLVETVATTSRSLEVE